MFSSCALNEPLKVDVVKKKQQMDDDEKEAIRLKFRERIQEMKATFKNNKNELDVTQSTTSTITESSESFGDDWSSSVPETPRRKAPRCPHVLKAFSKQAKKSSAGVIQALDNAVSSPQKTGSRPKLQRTESQRHRMVMDLHLILNKRQKPSIHKQKEESTTGKFQKQNKHNDKQGEDEKKITQEDDEERSAWIFGTLDDDDEEEWTCHSIRQRGARSRRSSIC